MTRVLQRLFPTDPVFMPVDVYIGGKGDIIIRQETTSPTGESYQLILIRRDQVHMLCEAMQRELAKWPAGAA